MEPTVKALLAGLPRRLADLPARHAAQAGVALDGPEGALTWAGLAEATERAAGALAARGVRGGDRVLIAAENGLPFALALLGCWRLDAWAIPANARLTAAELTAIAAHATPRLVLAGEAAGAFAASLAATPIPEGPLTGLAATAPLEATPEPTHPDAARQVAALIYTSGTMGTPKGVMLSHQAIALMAATSAALRGLSPEDRLFGVLPMSHVFGLSNMFAASLTAGARLSLTPRFEPTALAAALAEGVSVVQGVPAMFARLVAQGRAHGTLPAPRLRLLSSGGAPLDAAVQDGLEALFGLLPQNGYGLTEAGPTLTQTRTPRRDLASGPPIPGVELRFGPGGEIEARSPALMLGYYRDEAATQATFTPDGFLRTGDLGRLLPDGALEVTGRARELIIRSGFNVMPPEVEAALASHPAVLQAAVVGRRLADGNEEVVAFVQPRPGATPSPEELAAHAATRLAPYKRPSRILLMQALPASGTGKLLKHRLAEIARGLG